MTTEKSPFLCPKCKTNNNTWTTKVANNTQTVKITCNTKDCNTTWNENT